MMVAAPVTAPIHRIIIHDPERAVLVFETKPLGRLPSFTGRCEHCMRTHSEWWDMPIPDLFKTGDPDSYKEVLCGYCERVSLRIIAGV